MLLYSFGSILLGLIEGLEAPPLVDFEKVFGDEYEPFSG